MKQWIRICQSCGYELKSSSEPKNKSRASYGFRKCPKCKSEDFDWGSWRGYDTKPWRDKFKAITGQELIIPEAKLDELILNDEDGGGLFKGNAFLQTLIDHNH